MPARFLKKLIVFASRFPNEKRGSVAIYFGLAFVPMVIIAGGALDYARALEAKAALQTAADAAAIAVAQASALTQSQRLKMAQNIVAANLGPWASSITPAVNESDPSSSQAFYQVSATGSVPTEILSVAKINSIAIAAKSGAIPDIRPGQGNGCVVSLDSSAVDDIWDNGNASVTLTNCDIYDDSSNGAALSVGGSASMTARKVSVVGGVNGSSKITASAGIVTGAARMADPYASVPMPAYTDGNCQSYSTTTNATLNPGVYCGGFKVTSSAVVTLNPGLYVFDRGAFEIDGQATLQSATVNGVSGVTLVFTSSTGSNWPTVTINGGATINLTAPTTADIKKGNTGMNGILFYGDRNMPVGQSFDLIGGSTQTMTGAIYLPEAAVEYSGTTGTTNVCIQLIGDTIKFIGNSSVAISGCGAFALQTFGDSLTGYTDVKLVE